MPPYDPEEGGTVPIIRADDTVALENTVAVAGVARLGFIHQNGLPDLKAYDAMIDSLCNQGVSVIALVNQESLVMGGYNADNDIVRAKFRGLYTDLLSFLVEYYADRITYWEIWNEENFELGAKIEPKYYAHLLYDAYERVKAVNPDAQVLFGGLASAWGDSYAYAETVFETWHDQFGDASPFDYLAIHPYAREIEGPNPSVYMFAVEEVAEPGIIYQTIIDPFLKLLADYNVPDKLIIITEAGWNSAKTSPTRPVCHDSVLVTEAEQARYLKPLFDILHQIPLWEDPNTPAIQAIVWYQYMDIGAEDPCKQSKPNTAHAFVPLAEMSVQGAVDWWYGLFHGDKTTPKLAHCAFLHYPETCPTLYPHKTYLPLMNKNVEGAR